MIVFMSHLVVFNRLLGTGSSAQPGAMTPADLMIAIHNIDTTKCDMKTIIKATGICFQDKNVYTMEVLTIVLQQLMEQKDIPLLLLRTVIQSVALYPNLIGFTMNILQRLIVKQVWKQKMLWEGFIKCCERTKPQSFRVLLQVPPTQLRLLLDSAVELREPLLEHVQGFTESQRQHVPASIMQVLYNVNPETDTTGDASVDATNEAADAADAPDVANEKDVEKSEENIENTENENQVKEET